MSEVKVNKISPRSGTTVTLGDSGDTFTLASGVSLTGVNATFSGDLTVDTNTLFVESSTNRIGIGNTDPSVPLHLSNSAPIIRLEDTDTGAYSDINAVSSFGSLFIKADEGNTVADSILGFYVDNSEKMRIDSSGNVLVGKTGTSNQSNGFALIPNGASNIVRDGGACMQFNRKTTDGDILQFVKDATTVGSIGTEGSQTYIVTGDTGLKFASGVDAVVPVNAGGANRDNAIDLGVSTVRFKDLYMSGNIYLGGTGSANALDDYEEGTFTPAIAGWTLGSAIGKYTKIGNTVFYEIGTGTLTGSGTGTLEITGLPFVPVAARAASGTVMASFVNFSSTTVNLNAYIRTTSRARIYETRDNTGWNLLEEDDLISGSSIIYLSGTYEV